MKFSRYTSFGTLCFHIHSSLLKSFLFSGAEGIRTPDPLLARQVLSQLSYNPMLVVKWA